MNANSEAVQALVEALAHSQNALLDYVERLEKQGCGMGYGRSVIARNAAALTTYGREVE